MEMLINYTLKALVLPPGGPIFVMLLGLLLLRRTRRAGVTLLSLGLALLYVFSMPAFSRALLAQLQTYPALDAARITAASAGAIVVLGGGRYPAAPEYGGDTVSDTALVRLRYGAYLQRRTGLPVVVTGGSVFGEAVAEARLMGQVLANAFRIDAVWEERASRNTAENAFLTKALLEPKGIRRVYLVTDATHMPRAVEMFRRAGLEVIPAPTAFATGADDGRTGILDWLPSSGALSGTRFAFHEFIGRLWYRIRY